MDKILETPPIRFPERPVEDATERWWIAKVKPRQEKQLALDLIQHNIEYFLPLITKNSPRPGTRTPRLFTVPLFPGYICFAQDAPKDIFSTGRVVNLIEIRHQVRFKRECGQIYKVLQGKFPVEQYDEFIDGDSVEIEYGPLKGLCGIVAENRENSKLVLNVEGLGRACVTIDSAWVKHVEACSELA